MGIGMTVVEGLTRAMRGEVEAGRSELGGLRVDVRLRAAVVPSDVAGAPAESAEAATSGTPRAVAG
jgi:hypothetical protein